MCGCAATVPDFSPTLPALVPEILRRMGHLPVVEPAEEVRLLLAELVSTIITRYNIYHGQQAGYGTSSQSRVPIIASRQSIEHHHQVGYRS
jgi:nickel-dependent lactate racemase